MVVSEEKTGLKRFNNYILKRFKCQQPKSREPPKGGSPFLGCGTLTEGSGGMPQPDVYNYYPSSTSPPVHKNGNYLVRLTAKGSIAQFQKTVKPGKSR